jgi:hypothetical protein
VRGLFFAFAEIRVGVRAALALVKSPFEAEVKRPCSRNLPVINVLWLRPSGLQVHLLAWL